MLQAYLHHRVGYLHDVYLTFGEGEFGLAILDALLGYQHAVCGVYADVCALGGSCDAQGALVALHLDAAARAFATIVLSSIFS